MKNWKRVLSLFLAFLLMVTAGPLPIYGEEEPAKPKYKVTFTDDYGIESEPQEVEEGASAQIPTDFEPGPGELITAITDEEGNKKNPSAPIFRDENFTIEYGDQVDVTLSVVGDERHNGSKGYKDQIIEPTKVTLTSQDLEIQEAEGYPTNKRYATPANALIKVMEEKTPKELTDDFKEQVNKGYIAKMFGLKEFQPGVGDKSGWMYYINHFYSGYGVKEAPALDQDSIRYFFVEDYTNNYYTWFDKTEATVEAGTPLDLYLSYSHFETMGGKTTTGKYQGATIYVDGKEYKKDGQVVKTDASGKAQIVLMDPGRHTVSAKHIGENGLFLTTMPFMEVHVEEKSVDQNQEKVDKVAQAFKDNSQASNTLWPKFKENKNILPLIKERLSMLSGVNVENVEPVIASVDEKNHVKEDGSLEYVKREKLNPYGMNFENISFKIQFKLGEALSEPIDMRAMIAWDQDYFNKKIKEEADNFDFQISLGEGVNPEEVESSFKLPVYTTGSARTSWSKINWSTDHEEIFKVSGPDFDNKVNFAFSQPKEDTKVKITATFTANDGVLHSGGRLEKPEDFQKQTKEYTITVKGTGEESTTEEGLKALLDKYYLPENIKYSKGGSKVDFTQVLGDLQLLRYTRITDDQGKNVFNRNEITVTSDTPAVTINGYRANVDRFAKKEDLKGNLIIKLTRDGLSAEKKIPFTIKPVTEEELATELKMMDLAKKHFFDGINDGQNKDKDHVTKNLHAFEEMNLDENGKLIWIYKANDKTGKGIIADFFLSSSQMESLGYRRFKSSNPAIISHENLLVNPQESAQEVTISTLLSSAQYKDSAEKHPENQLLQKLYKQPVEVTVIVKGTAVSTDALEKKIQEGEALLGQMVEGSAPGQYPQGSKDSFQGEITKAKKALENPEATDEQIEAATRDLDAVIKATRAKANPLLAKVRIIAQDKENAYSEKSGFYDVQSSAAEKYGYVKPEDYKNKVTVADALATYHRAVYGEDFEKNPQKYLGINNSGFITKIFGVETTDVGYKVNNKMPTNPDKPDMGSVANDSLLKEGDQLNIFRYFGDYNENKYLYFDKVDYKGKAGESLNIKVLTEQYSTVSQKLEEVSVEKATVVVKKDGTVVAQGTTDGNGLASIQLAPDMKGDYDVTVGKVLTDAGKEGKFIAPYAGLTVKEKEISLASLEAILEEAENLPEVDRISPDGKDVNPDQTWVTQEVDEALTTAKEEANNLIWEESQYQDKIEAAIQKLRQAIDNYQPMPGTKKVVDADFNLVIKGLENAYYAENGEEEKEVSFNVSTTKQIPEGMKIQVTCGGDEVEGKDGVYKVKIKSKQTNIIDIRVVDENGKTVQKADGNEVKERFVINLHTIKVIDFKPAPGQFVNTSWTDYKDPNKIKENSVGSGLTLGSFGGHLIVDMLQPVKNDPKNPYGVDFTVFGNAFEISGKPNKYNQEPAAVYVMKDENGNGLPDDTWYELAGSEHGKETTIRDYQITYTNPKGVGKNIPWKDSLGNSGFVYANNYHKQEYYPLHANFPNINPDQESYQGTLILKGIDPSDITVNGKHQLRFGYAESRKTQLKGDLTSPDNPYTPDALEGSGGDAFDISWAIDKAGNPVQLDEIRFIKIVSATNANQEGGTGEISPEITGVTRTKAIAENIDALKISSEIKRDYLEIGSSEYLIVQAYKDGKEASHGDLVWTTSDSSLAKINPVTGLVEGLAPGEVEVTVSSKANPSIQAKYHFTVGQPIEIQEILGFQYPGDKKNITAQGTVFMEPLVQNQFGEKIEIGKEDIQWESLTPDKFIMKPGFNVNGWVDAKGKETGVGRLKYSYHNKSVEVPMLVYPEDSVVDNVYGKTPRISALDKALSLSYDSVILSSKTAKEKSYDEFVKLDEAASQKLAQSNKNLIIQGKFFEVQEGNAGLKTPDLKEISFKADEVTGDESLSQALGTAKPEMPLYDFTANIGSGPIKMGLKLVQGQFKAEDADQYKVGHYNKDTGTWEEVESTLDVERMTLYFNYGKDGIYTVVKGNLKKTIDKKEIQEVIKKAEEIQQADATSADGKDIDKDKTWVTPEIQETFDQALKKAKEVNEKADASQDEVNQAAKALEDAIKAYKPQEGKKEAVLPVDKAKLKEALSQAEAMKKADETSADGKDIDKDKTWVTPEIQEAFDQALKKAKAVDAKVDASQDEVNQATQGLKEAMASYIPQEGKKEAVLPVDKAKLKEALDQAEAMKKADATSADGKDIDKDKTWVTPEIQEAFDQALKKAKEVNENADASQEEVTQATQDLKDVMASYIPQNGTKDIQEPVDKKALRTALEEAKAVKQADTTSPDGKDVAKDKTWVTPEVQRAFDQAKAKAQALLKNAEATKDEVNQATKELEEAIKDYKPQAGSKEKDKPVEPDKPIGPDKPVDPGKTNPSHRRKDKPSPSTVLPSQVDIKKEQKEMQEVISFMDIQGHWAEKVIQEVAKKGYFKGTSATTFSPNKTTTRAEFVTVLGRLANINPSQYPKAKQVDIKEGSYYQAYANWAIAEGIVKGTDANHFSPDQKITREEVATILARYLEKQGKLEDKNQAQTYKDQDQVSSWAKEAVKNMTAAGIFKGQDKGKFAPKKSLTRAEFAQVIYNMNW